MSVIWLDPENLSCDPAEAREAGTRLAEPYRSAAPFPHIVLDDFVSADLLSRIIAEWPSTEDKSFFDRSQERLKYQWSRGEIASPFIRAFLAEMNSPGVIGFIEGLTGIKKLIPDPYFTGGGLHETKAGGHLSVHADFNVHTGMDLIRRINLLIYLNEDWDEAFGGNLELWDERMEACVERVSPLLGRAVIFNTDADSFHGQPEPLACPPDSSRRSVALYYYTAAPDGVRNIRRRTTQFKPRPNTQDKTDWSVRINVFLDGWVPPLILSTARRSSEAIRRRLPR